MSMMRELGTLVEGWGFGTIAGTPPTIHFGRILPTPDSVVILIPGLGRRPERRMGVGKAGIVYHQPSVQVVVRRMKGQAELCESVAWQLHNQFDNWAGTVLGTRYFLIECQQPPFSMAVDENQRPIFLFNLHVRREPIE